MNNQPGLVFQALKQILFSFIPIFANVSLFSDRTSGLAPTGVTFVVIFIYTKFFDWWWELMPKYLFFLIMSLMAILCLVIFKRLREFFGMVARDHMILVNPPEIR